MNIYIAALLLSLGLFGVIFLVAWRQRNYHFINAFWPLGFIAISLLCLVFRVGGWLESRGSGLAGCGTQLLRYVDGCTTHAASSLPADPITYWPALLATGLVSIWGLRLSWHILKRNNRKSGRLKHADAVVASRGTARIFVQLALSEAVLLWIVAAPLIFLYTVTFDRSVYQELVLLAPAIIGALLWLVGFVYELVSDAQLHAFTKNPKNAGKTMTTGLWRYSRHPNYFGEAIMWWGIFVITLAAPEPPFWLIIPPLVITYMLRYVSGVPVLEKKYAGDKTYQAYKRRTNAIIPWRPDKA